jgi:hypothetical protein
MSKYILPNLGNDVINIDKLKNKEYCCLCGYHVLYHDDKRHHFFQIKDEYKCQVCDKFFFQHSHKNNPCFRPYTYL